MGYHADMVAKAFTLTVAVPFALLLIGGNSKPYSREAAEKSFRALVAAKDSDILDLIKNDGLVCFADSLPLDEEENRNNGTTTYEMNVRLSTGRYKEVWTPDKGEPIESVGNCYKAKEFVRITAGEKEMNKRIEPRRRPPHACVSRTFAAGQRSSILLRISSVLEMASEMVHSLAVQGLLPISFSFRAAKIVAANRIAYFRCSSIWILQRKRDDRVKQSATSGIELFRGQGTRHELDRLRRYQSLRIVSC